MKKDLVSVIMPVYNGDKFLAAAIESVLKQTHKNIELIIVDDGSSDRSFAIAKRFASRDKRVKVLTNIQNKGIPLTLNKAIKNSTGDFIARVDADDVIHPRRLKSQVEFLKRNTDLVAVGSWVNEINEHGDVIGKREAPLKHQEIYEMMGYVNGIQNPSAMFNRKMVPKSFEWYKKDHEICEDLDLFFRIVKYGKFANIPDYLTSYRIHNDNISLKNTKQTYWKTDEIRSYAIRYYGYEPTLKVRLYRYAAQLAVRLIPERGVLKTYSLFRSLYQA